MLTVADIQPHIEREFGSRLEPHGFQQRGQRGWFRSTKRPIREFFGIGAMKGGAYSPAWGFSTGFMPDLQWRSGTFRRQSTDRNAITEFGIDPMDITDNVPPQAFRFTTGYHTEVPETEIRLCAEYFVPQALADFDRVQTVSDFCEFFLSYSRRGYPRFTFQVDHLLVHGFVLILTGKRDEGVEMIREFCRKMNADFEDKILLECIRNAEAYRVKLNPV